MNYTNKDVPIVHIHGMEEDRYVGLLNIFQEPPEGHKEYLGHFMREEDTYHKYEAPEIINFDVASNFVESVMTYGNIEDNLFESEGLVESEYIVER